MESTKKRIWEIDFLRGIALILMVVFHIVFDMSDIYGYPIYYDRGFFYYVGKVSAILFMLVSGVSCSLSRSNAKRGVRIFGIAMIITLVTHLYDSGLGIKFGILHFLGICMILYPLFKPVKGYLLILVATAIIIVGNIFAGITIYSELLFPIGLTTATFTSSDYYPLLPWMGVFLYGVFAGKTLYGKRESLLKFEIKDNPVMMLGRHTLLVYIMHQPLILLALEMIDRYTAAFK